MKFIFHIDVMSSSCHFGKICVANSAIFRRTIQETMPAKCQDNEVIPVGKGQSNSKSGFCFHTLESNGRGPLPVGQVRVGSWSN